MNYFIVKNLSELTEPIITELIEFENFGVYDITFFNSNELGIQIDNKYFNLYSYNDPPQKKGNIEVGLDANNNIIVGLE